MCSGGNYAAGAISAMSQTINTIAANKQASANGAIIDTASVQRSNEISSNGSLQLNETMMAARAARAHSIAAASGSGINLGSNSFLASLQTTAMATANKSQVELENTANAEQDNFIKTQSELDQKASKSTFAGWFVNNNMAYLSGAFGGSASTPQTNSPLGDQDANVPNVPNDGQINGNTTGDGIFTGSGLGNSDLSGSSSLPAGMGMMGSSGTTDPGIDVGNA